MQVMFAFLQNLYHNTLAKMGGVSIFLSERYETSPEHLMKIRCFCFCKKNSKYKGKTMPFWKLNSKNNHRRQIWKIKETFLFMKRLMAQLSLMFAWKTRLFGCRKNRWPNCFKKTAL